MSSPARETLSKSPRQSPAREREQSSEEHRHKRARVDQDSEEEEEEEEEGQESSQEDGEVEQSEQTEEVTKASSSADNISPPLPTGLPPLPIEPLPEKPKDEDEDDGWAPIWDQNAQAYYFYNRFTSASQWTNPRVPPEQETSSTIPPAPGTESTSKPTSTSLTSPPPPTSEALPAGGYNPAIHGDYDPNAWYAQTSTSTQQEGPKVGDATSTDPAAAYAATAAFNRFTGRFQNAELTPENYNDDNKSKRQMNAFFDVDAAANSHEGKSLKAERSGKKLTKTELKNFKEKRKAKKEEKRRAWLKD